MPRIYTEEQKEEKYLYIIQWRNINKDKVKCYQYKVRQNPERKIREKARKEKTYSIIKEYNRLKHLGTLFL